MATKDGDTLRDLIARLEANPRRFDFFWAVRILQARMPAEFPAVGASLLPEDDFVRFRQNPSQELPLTQVVDLQKFQTDPDCIRFILTISFFGMFGYNGPLPVFLTELAAKLPERPNEDSSPGSRARPGDIALWDPSENSLAAFVNLFHHRLISLLYRAWAIVQKTVSLDRNVVPATFAVADLANLPALVERLRKHEDPVTDYLWDQFLPSVRKLLFEDNAAIRRMRHVLVEEFNRIGRGQSIFDPNRFAGVELSPQTRTLLPQAEVPPLAPKLNRLLLEDAFPRELAKSRSESGRYPAFFASLIGVSDLRQSSAVPLLRKLYYSGWLAAPTRGSEGLGNILSDYFQLPARAIPFFPRWMDIPSESRCCLENAPQHSMGGATIGDQVLTAQSSFRIRMGPLKFGDFRRFFPGQLAWKELVDWIDSFAGPEYLWDLQLILQRDEVPAFNLGEGLALGLSTWFKSGEKDPLDHDAEDLILNTDTDVPIDN